MNWDHEPPKPIICVHGADWLLLSLRERIEVRGKGFLASRGPSRVSITWFSAAVGNRNDEDLIVLWFGRISQTRPTSTKSAKGT